MQKVSISTRERLKWIALLMLVLVGGWLLVIQVLDYVYVNEAAIGAMRLVQGTGQSPYACLIVPSLCKDEAEQDEMSAPLWVFQALPNGDVLLTTGRVDGAEGDSYRTVHMLLPADRALTRLALGGMELQKNSAMIPVSWQRLPGVSSYLESLAGEVESPVEAAKLYQRSQLIQPTVRSYYELGNILRQKDELDAALKTYEQGLALADDSPEAQRLKPVILTKMGHIYRRLGDKEMARQAYEEALVQRDDLPETIEGLALFDRQDGRVDMAISRLMDGIGRLPRAVTLRYRLAEIYYAQGEIDRARNELSIGVEVRPEFAPSWRLLGDIAREEGDYDTALDFYEAYLKLRPEDSYIQDRIEELRTLGVEAE